VARIDISGIGIEYELLGEVGNHAIVLNPGGRMSKDAPGMREMADQLVAGGKRVLLWDRPNCGASDICFEDDSESGLQGRILAELIRALDLGPAAVAGGSAGSRTALQTALHDPDIVSHLIPWWISGGTLSLLMLGASYYSEAAIAASMGGMEAVVALPIWSEQMSRNPRNRDIMLAMDAEDFIGRMGRWAESFMPTEDSPVPGMLREDFARLTMPTMIFRGSPKDLFHPASIGEQVHHMIPGSELVDAPWTEEEFLHCTKEAARTGTGHFANWHKLAPAIVEFTGRR